MPCDRYGGREFYCGGSGEQGPREGGGRVMGAKKWGQRRTERERVRLARNRREQREKEERRGGGGGAEEFVGSPIGCPGSTWLEPGGQQVMTQA